MVTYRLEIRITTTGKSIHYELDLNDQDRSYPADYLNPERRQQVVNEIEDKIRKELYIEVCDTVRQGLNTILDSWVDRIALDYRSVKLSLTIPLVNSIAKVNQPQRVTPEANTNSPVQAVAKQKQPKVVSNPVTAATSPPKEPITELKGDDYTDF